MCSSENENAIYTFELCAAFFEMVKCWFYWPFQYYFFHFNFQQSQAGEENVEWVARWKDLAKAEIPRIFFIIAIFTLK